MNTLDDTLNDFIARTSNSKVAVIVPLYGYWADVEDNFLNRQTLKIVLDKIKSSVHSLYIIFIGEDGRVPKDIQTLLTKFKAAGNCITANAPIGSTYAEYLRIGLSVAHDETDAAYFININPWVLLQSKSIDVMVDRLNVADEAKLISGFDVKSTIADPDKFTLEDIEAINYQPIIENRDMDCNFFGVTRYALEMALPDQNIKTSWFFERDMWQMMYTQGFEVITSQLLPIFVFDVNISQKIEAQSDIDEDKIYFQKKWHFVPTIIK